MSGRHQHGIRMIKALDAEQVGALVESLADIAPEFAVYVIEFAFGDNYARPGLDPHARQVSILSSLVALGSPPQIYSRLRAALSAGLTRKEIVEVIMQSAVYAGFPAALNAFVAAKTVFAQEGQQQTAP